MQKGINVVGEVGQSPLQDVDVLKKWSLLRKDMVVTSYAVHLSAEKLLYTQ